MKNAFLSIKKIELVSISDSIDYAKYGIIAYFRKISLYKECLPNLARQGMIYCEVTGGRAIRWTR